MSLQQGLDAVFLGYTGFWINWSKGDITGLTLTLPPAYATQLTNVLALFVTLAGSQLWTIITFAIHQFRSSHPPTPLSTLHTLQQVILRNTVTDVSTARLSLTLLWKRRHEDRKSLIPSILILGFALLHVAFFIFAGTFSDKLINAGPSILSASPGCGVWNQTYWENAVSGAGADSSQDLASMVQYEKKIAADIQASQGYAEQCYLSHSSAELPEWLNNTSICATLPKTNLLSQIMSTASCPFEASVCHQDSDTIVFDTGWLDSHNDFGVNAPPNERLGYRRVTQCAVLNDTTHVTGWNSSVLTEEFTREGIAYALYGPSLTMDSAATYAYSNSDAILTNFTRRTGSPYHVSAQIAYAPSEPSWTSSDFSPLAEFMEVTADINLIFLSFSGHYTQAVDDPWFAAHIAEPFSTDTTGFQEMFSMDTIIRTVGCAEQHSFCTSAGYCTDFLGLNQVQNNMFFNASLTPRQNATLDRLVRAVAASNLNTIADYISTTSTPLLASNTVISGHTTALSLGLPADQWISELEYWYSIAMAHLQRTVVMWATGTVAPSDAVGALLPPTSEQDVWFCHNLLLPSRVYQSFDVLALFWIILSGSLIIVASFTVESVTTWAQERSNFGTKCRQNWLEDEMLRLRERLDERHEEEQAQGDKSAMTVSKYCSRPNK